MTKKMYTVTLLLIMLIIVVLLGAVGKLISSDNYYSLIVVDSYSAEKGFIAGTVLQSNHLPENSKVDFVLDKASVDETLLRELVGAANVKLKVTYQSCKNQELLKEHPFNPVDLLNITAIEWQK